MDRSSWTLIISLALGAAALVLAFVPSSWPNPLADDAEGIAPQRVAILADAAAAVDAACERGDGAAFAQVTTASYRRGLERRLSAVDADLDGETLRAMAKASANCAAWLRKPVLATYVSGQMVAIVVARDGAGAGAQVLVFAWNGGQFLLDDSRHAPRVETKAAAKRFAAELVRQREAEANAGPSAAPRAR